jgi:hypothetical protein
VLVCSIDISFSYYHYVFEFVDLLVFVVGRLDFVLYVGSYREEEKERRRLMAAVVPKKCDYSWKFELRCDRPPVQWESDYEFRGKGLGGGVSGVSA